MKCPKCKEEMYGFEGTLTCDKCGYEIIKLEIKLKGFEDFEVWRARFYSIDE